MMNEKAFRQAYELGRNGANQFFRHSLVRFFAYSDGVQEVAEAGCYWLLDIVATEIAPKIARGTYDGQHHGWVVVISKDKKAWISLEFEEGESVYTREVNYTDLPAGKFEFEIGYDGTNVLFSLISEH
jgi:hypothetical protein